MACAGDPCWLSPCESRTLNNADARASYNSTTQQCSCGCMNSTQIYDTSTTNSVCHDPVRYCRSMNQCGKGICSVTTSTCVCQAALYRGIRCNETCSCNLRHLYNDTSSNVIACNFETDTCVCATGWKGRFCNETDSSANVRSSTFIICAFAIIHFLIKLFLGLLCVFSFDRSPGSTTRTCAK